MAVTKAAREQRPARLAQLEVPVLQGRSVLLRPLAADDGAALAAAAGESRASYGHTHVPGEGDAGAAYVGKALQQRAQGRRWPLVIEFEGRAVGSTSFYEGERWDWPEASPLARPGGLDAVKIGYTWLAHSAQRTGCNTEAKLLMLQHAFEAWRVHRVALCTDERNLRSRQAMERIGARFEGVLRAHMPAADGGLRNTALFAITAEDWPAVRAGLLARLGRSDGPKDG